MKKSNTNTSNSNNNKSMNSDSSPTSSSLSVGHNGCNNSKCTGSNLVANRPIFRGEFKNYKVDKPKRMSKSITPQRKDKKTILLDQQPILQVNPPKPIPTMQKKESIMSQLTFHESYSKDLCPFGSVKVKNNPVRNHPYVQQFVLNTCQSSVVNNSSKSPKLSTRSTMLEMPPLSKVIPQKENQQNFQIFHFKVGHQPTIENNCSTPPNTSFKSSSSCSSTNTSNSSTTCQQESLKYGGIAKPIMMESVHQEQVEPELIILPPFRQVEKSENIKIPSIKHIENLIHTQKQQGVHKTQIYS